MESWKWAGYGNLAMLAGLGGILLSALTGIGIVDPWTNPLGWQLATAWRLGCASYLCLFFLSCAFLRWGREDTWMSRAMRSLLHVAIVLGTAASVYLLSQWGIMSHPSLLHRECDHQRVLVSPLHRRSHLRPSDSYGT